MTVEPKPAFKKPTISLAASGVDCTRWLGGSFDQSPKPAEQDRVA